MPIFEYACDDCGTQFEKLVRRSEEDNAVECPSCGQDHVRTKISSFAPRANGIARDAAPAPSCAGCPTPGMCSRN